MPVSAKQLNLCDISNDFDNNLYEDLRFYDAKNSFDADNNYAYFYKKDIMPIINFNPRNTQGLPEPRFNKLGLLLCPNTQITLFYQWFMMVFVEKNIIN